LRDIISAHPENTVKKIYMSFVGNTQRFLLSKEMIHIITPAI